MKTIIITFVALLTFNLSAQTEVEGEEISQDTTRFQFGGTEFIIIKKNDGQTDTIRVENGDDEQSKWEGYKEKKYDSFGHWSGLEFGVNTMLNSSGNTSFNQDFLTIDPSQSWNFSINFGELDIPFKTPHVGIVSGLGFEHSRYGLKNDYLLKANSDSTWAVKDTNQVYFKNQLRTWSFNLPILLEFNTSKYEDNNVYFDLGLIGGVHFGTKTFKKYEINGGEQKDKFKGTYNVNPFKVMATARVGYKNVGLFVNYNLLPLFSPGTTQLAYPLTFGIRLG
jgi:hypothetical protein